MTWMLGILGGLALCIVLVQEQAKADAVALQLQEATLTTAALKESQAARRLADTQLASLTTAVLLRNDACDRHRELHRLQGFVSE